MISHEDIGFTERSIILICKANGTWRWIYEDNSEYYNDKIFYSRQEALESMYDKTKNCRVIQSQVK